MISLDTNVLVRLFVDDGNHAQINAARKTAQEAKQVYLSQIVQVELVWVLSAAYEFTKSQILKILYELHENLAFNLQNPEQFFKALKQFETCNADFSDCLTLIESKEQDATPIYTFDKRFSKLPGAQLLNL